MDVKLKVLGGAKAGLEIALKKDQFTIGRSAECSLRAGSDAISRRHCIIRIEDSKISIEDLKSRNGTFVNGRRIEEKATLSGGDEVRVGPLRFELVAGGVKIRSPRPQMQKVAAEAAKGAAGETSKAAPRVETIEESIDQWLTSPTSDSVAMHETTTLRLDETQGGQVRVPDDETIDYEVQPNTQEGGDSEPKSESGDTSGEDVDEGSGIRRKDKKEPGKLPPRPKGPMTKDSREAAAEVLRAMTRRR